MNAGPASKRGAANANGIPTVSLESMLREDDRDIPVLLGEKPRNQNPLRMLELLVKGFCPTIIRDRMEEIQEEERNNKNNNNNQEMDNKLLPNAAAAAAAAAKRRSGSKPGSKRRKTPPTIGQPQQQLPLPIQPPMPELSSIVDDSLTTSSTTGTGTDKHYFEIGERTEDIRGLSKKIWEGFCYNPYDDSTTSGNKIHPLHRGFCKILSDQLCHTSTNGEAMNEDAPDGEECSVDSDASYSSSLDVDLSPQSSATLPRTSTGEDMRDDDEHTDGESDSDGEEDEFDEEEEQPPIAEFLYTNRSKRRIRRAQVLVSTVLAVYTTFVLLQKLDTVYDKNFHFALKRKEISSTSSAGRTGLSSIMNVSKNSKGTEKDEGTALEVMDVLGLVAPAISIPSMREKVQTTFASPFGAAFVEFLREGGTLPKYN